MIHPSVWFIQRWLILRESNDRYRRPAAALQTAQFIYSFFVFHNGHLVRSAIGNRGAINSRPRVFHKVWPQTIVVHVKEEGQEVANHGYGRNVFKRAVKLGEKIYMPDSKTLFCCVCVCVWLCHTTSSDNHIQVCCWKSFSTDKKLRKSGHVCGLSAGTEHLHRESRLIIKQTQPPNWC